MNAFLKKFLVRFQPTTSKIEAASEALAAIERVYLRAYGWTFIGDDYWRPPKGFPKPYPHRHGHAVNSQKWHQNNDLRYR